MERDSQSYETMPPLPTQGGLTAANPRNNRRDAAKNRNREPCAACQDNRKKCLKQASGICKRCELRREECVPRRKNRRGDIKFVNESARNYGVQRTQTEPYESRPPEMHSPAAMAQQLSPRAVAVYDESFRFGRQNTGIFEALEAPTTVHPQDRELSEHNPPVGASEASVLLQGTSIGSVQMHETITRNAYGNYDVLSRMAEPTHNINQQIETTIDQRFSEVNANPCSLATPENQTEYVQATTYGTTSFPSSAVANRDAFCTGTVPLPEVSPMTTFDSFSYGDPWYYEFFLNSIAPVISSGPVQAMSTIIRP